MNNTSIITKAIEKDEDRSLVKKYGVEGFPTILLLDSDGKKLDTYNGDRNAQSLLSYCKKNN
jgi:thioredoxin-related protein